MEELTKFESTRDAREPQYLPQSQPNNFNNKHLPTCLATETDLATMDLSTTMRFYTALVEMYVAWRDHEKANTDLRRKLYSTQSMLLQCLSMKMARVIIVNVLSTLLN